jgi:hypothetical protein
MSSRREIVERKLDVKLPEQYSLFLDKYCIYDAPGAEVYGMDDNLEHLEERCRMSEICQSYTENIATCPELPSPFRNALS